MTDLQLLAILTLEMTRGDSPQCRRWAIILGRFFPEGLDVESQYPDRRAPYVVSKRPVTNYFEVTYTEVAEEAEEQEEDDRES